MHKEYYKGEGVDFPQVKAMVSLISSCLPMAHLCTKNVPNYALNQLVVWFVQVHVNNYPACHSS